MGGLIFHKLIIRDFKSYRGKHVFNLERTPGLYYVTGVNEVHRELESNGAGKTSLWDALTWCLWGRTGKDNRPAKSIIPRGYKGKTYVTCVFKSKHGRFALLRSRNPNRLRIRLTGTNEDWKEITQTDIPKMLTMSEGMFMTGVLRAQAGKMFMDLGTEEQSRLFNDALSLDIWLQASKRAGDERRRLNEKKDKQNAKLMGVLGELKGALEARAEARAGLKAYEKNQGTALALEHELVARIEKREERPEAEVTRLESALHKLVRESSGTAYEIQGLERGLGALRRQLEEFRSKTTCPECGQELPKADRKKKIEAAKKAIQSAKNSLEATRMLTSTYQETMAELKEALRKARNRRLTYHAAKLAIHKATTSNPFHKALKGARENIEHLQGRKDGIRTNIADSIYRIGIAEYWQTAFKEIRVQLIEQVLGELSVATNAHFANLGVDDGWRIEFKAIKEKKNGEITVAFNVLLHDPKHDEPIKWQTYSGGESQRWNLAIAFGLSEVVLSRAGVSPNIEILDEPTKGLNPKGIDYLLEHLKSRAGDNNRAVYVVEQHSLERGQFDGTITIRKNKHGSRIEERT